MINLFESIVPKFGAFTTCAQPATGARLPAIYSPDPLYQAEQCELLAAYYSRLAESLRLLDAIQQLLGEVEV